jgi:hypothetical protein
MKYLQFTTPLKAAGGWTTETAAAYITGYQINESRVFDQPTSTKNVSVQVQFYKSLVDKQAGELSFQPVSESPMMATGVYLNNISGTITDAKILALTLAHFTDKGHSATLVDDIGE